MLIQRLLKHLLLSGSPALSPRLVAIDPLVPRFSISQSALRQIQRSTWRRNEGGTITKKDFIDRASVAEEALELAETLAEIGALRAVAIGNEERFTFARHQRLKSQRRYK